jgi:hypothetical protein
MEQRIQIKYSPSWRRWNLNGSSLPVQHFDAGDTLASKEAALQRLTSYVQSCLPGTCVQKVSEDEYVLAPMSFQEG